MPQTPRAGGPGRAPVSTTDVTVLLSQAPEPAGACGLDASSWHLRSLEIHLIFLQSPQDGFYSDFEVCHWVGYRRNKPAGFHFVRGYLMCSQNIENTLSADKSRKVQCLCSLRKSFTPQHITCDLS